MLVLSVTVEIFKAIDLSRWWTEEPQPQADEGNLAYLYTVCITRIRMYAEIQHKDVHHQTVTVSILWLRQRPEPHRTDNHGRKSA